MLTSKTLALWLESYGLSYTSIGLFGLLNLPYALKFVWAPILDHVSLPYLKPLLGQRRSWLCLAQVMAILSLVGMTRLDPIENMGCFFACGLMVSIAAASQHILLLTYQIETLNSRDWGIGEGMSISAFKIAILTSSGGAMYLAQFMSWQEVYLIISILLFIGLFAVLVMKEPDRNVQASPQKTWEWFWYIIMEPLKTFTSQKGWLAIIILMLFYRLPENLFQMMQLLFFQDLGFSTGEIITVVKVFGMTASICGSIAGGYFIRTKGYKWTLFWGALLHGMVLICFLVLAKLGTNLPFFYLTVGLECFLSGLTLTAFFSYQLTCVSITFAATQLALLTSLEQLSRSFASPVSGFVIDTYGWTSFLGLLILSSIPGVLWISRTPFSRT